MKLNVVSEDKSSMVFELEGAQHSFPALLCWALLKDPKVEMAMYNVEHPLVGRPKIHVKTKSEEPRKAIEAALKLITSELEGVRKGVGSAKPKAKK
jgi:DNA-directed RNA polymerase subunit L